MENLYLTDNGLNKISFVNELELPSIKKIVLNQNNIDEFKSLMKYKKTIEEIEIKDNCIINIDYLEDFINECTKLTSIGLSQNEIDLNDDINQKIIRNIRNKGIRVDV